MPYYYHDNTNWIISSEFLPCTGLHRSITSNQVATRVTKFQVQLQYASTGIIYLICIHQYIMHSNTGVYYITLFTAVQASLPLQYSRYYHKDSQFAAYPVRDTQQSITNYPSHGI